MTEKNASRTYQILKELLERNTCISVGALAKQYNCSERTIRTEVGYIKDILKKYNIELIHRKMKGYVIVPNESHEISEIRQKIMEETSIIPSNYSERIYYILKRILLSEDYLTIEQLSDELFVSRVSVTQSLKRVREILNEYHLNLENKPHYGLKIQGEEKDIRKCIIEHGINYSQLNFWDFKNYSDVQNLPFFKDIDLLKINHLIKAEIAKAGITFYDIFYNNLIIHIAVAIKRIQEKSYIEEFSIESEDLYINDIQVANQIAKQLSHEFHIDFPESEIHYIAVHLIGNKIADIDENRLFLDETYILVNKMLLLASKEFDIDFMSDNILKKDLYIHIKSALTRIHLGIQLHNPMIQQLKDNFPFPFEIAINVCYNKEIGLYELGEEELGYVVIHFAAAFERLKEKSAFKKKVLIFCASGIGTVRLLEAKLRNEFKDYIEITTSYDMTHINRVQEDYDLILSTIPLKNETCHVLCVSPIPTNDDMSHISKILMKTTRNRYYQIQEVFYPELFHIEDKAMSKNDLLLKISQDLYELGYVNHLFYDGLLKREEIVDTVIGSLFAIPHPLKNIALKNGIYVYISKEPIQWTEEKNVSVIFVLVIKRSEAKYFEKIYDLIVNIASDIENVHRIIDCHNFEDVIGVLNNIAKDE